MLLSIRQNAVYLLSRQLYMFLLVTCILWFFVDRQGLWSWSMGAGLGMFGSAWLGWRFGPRSEKLTAQAWLYRWYASLALKWLLIAAMLAVFFSLDVTRFGWLWAGYGLMCVAHIVVFALRRN
jgi:hypothetical protein